MSGLQLAICLACLSQLQNFYCKTVLAKAKKKKVRSWRTNDEEDMALPIIQEKEKGFTKKNHPKIPPKIGRNTWRQLGRRMMHHFSRASPKKHVQLLNKE